MGNGWRQHRAQAVLKSLFGTLALGVGLALMGCQDSPQERCVQARLKVWDAHSEKTPWRISEATGQTRSDFEAKARQWCAQEVPGS